MDDSLTLAIFAGLGGMLGWGFADFFAKKTIDKVGDLVSLVWAHLFGTIFFLIAIFFNWVANGSFIVMPQGLGAWAGLFFFGALQMFIYWLVYKGFGKGQLSILSPVFASYSGLVAIVSIIFFNEKLSSGIIAALVGIFIGIILININPRTFGRKFNIVPGLKEISLAAILAAAWTIGWDKFVADNDFLSYAFFMYFFMSMAAYTAAIRKNINLKRIESRLWKFLVLIGAGETIAYFSITLGFNKSTHTSIVALLSGSFSLPVVILSFLFLKERLTILHAAAIALIIAGIVLISLA